MAPDSFCNEKTREVSIYNMFNCDKVKNNEVPVYLFFTPMSRSGAIFFALALLRLVYLTDTLIKNLNR